MSVRHEVSDADLLKIVGVLADAFGADHVARVAAVLADDGGPVRRLADAAAAVVENPSKANLDALSDVLYVPHHPTPNQ